MLLIVLLTILVPPFLNKKYLYLIKTLTSC
nr:MAG TPA: hypothetical protein [Caudoviricetes sp.]